ncbi:MAG TPA: glycine--tRNA ligase [Ignavibacteria bacterium]|nr:glycine--tRNA ligase [Ignavibacteria bacterium]HMR38898.1 glycine--tRNA ligase [Ignavibacteria bacterium]
MSDKKNSNKSDVTEKIVSLSKRRGLIFQSSEIYGGLNGCYDYGPLGVELLRNIKEAWWKEMTYREDVEGLDASILMHPRVWEASGHVEHFSDPMVDCKSCKSRYRVDVLFETLSAKNKKVVSEEILKANSSLTDSEDSIKEFFTSDPNPYLSLLVCPNCGNKETFTEARSFNLMFKTFIGPLEDSSNAVFLRPETAQGIYVNFNNVKESSRQKLPFGIAQVGKAFRNEINTKNFLFRTREFEQMEMQYFINPADDDKWFEYWREQRFNWFIKYGMDPAKLKLHVHEKLAHYAKAAVDIEFEFPFGWGEIEGIHNRTDFDLKRHTEFSGKKIEYFDDQTKERFTPYVIETSAGASRSFFAFLCNAYDEEEMVRENSDGTSSSETRTVLRFHPALAPIKAAVFPLVNRDGMQDIAQNISADLRKNFKVFYDDSGAVGRRYRRQDECGTPFCITVDSDTLTDDTVTVRDRDSMVQERINKDNIQSYINSKLI